MRGGSGNSNGFVFGAGGNRELTCLPHKNTSTPTREVKGIHWLMQTASRTQRMIGEYMLVAIFSFSAGNRVVLLYLMIDRFGFETNVAHWAAGMSLGIMIMFVARGLRNKH